MNMVLAMVDAIKSLIKLNKIKRYRYKIHKIYKAENL